MARIRLVTCKRWCGSRRRSIIISTRPAMARGLVAPSRFTRHAVLMPVSRDALGANATKRRSEPRGSPRTAAARGERQEGGRPMAAWARPRAPPPPCAARGPHLARLRQATQLQNDGRLSEAVPIYEDVLRPVPSRRPPFVGPGRVGGRRRRKAKDLLKGVFIRPNDPTMLSNLGKFIGVLATPRRRGLLRRASRLPRDSVSSAT